MDTVGIVEGYFVGAWEGLVLGLSVVATADGSEDGASVISSVGARDGSKDIVGFSEGRSDGLLESVGYSEAESVGNSVEDGPMEGNADNEGTIEGEADTEGILEGAVDTDGIREGAEDIDG